MIWNHTDKSKLKMKNLSLEQIKTYLENIKTEILLSYGCLPNRGRRVRSI